MGYTNAIIRVDPINGSNAALSNLTGVSFTWNSGTSKMRGTHTNHGLTTGQIIQITGSTGLNDYWKVTVIDSNTFDLDLSPNVANTTGTVVRFRGSSWSQAFASLDSANWPFLRAGDEIRVARTPLVQTSVNSTWTNGSATVTLASNSIVRLLNGATSTSGWVAATNVTLSTNSTRKYGSSSLSISTNASFTTGKLAHFTFGSTQDLSSFNTLCLWLVRNTGTIDANSIRVALCSDSNGNTPVDEITIGHTVQYSAFYPLVLRKTSLGSNINSIAIYADTSFSSRVILINDIFVSTGLSLFSMIGGSGIPFFAVDAVDDTNITLGSHYTTSFTSDNFFGFNTTTTSLWYYDKTNVDFASNTTGNIARDIFSSSRANSALTYIYSNYTIRGGYNTSNDTVDGRTVLTCVPTGSSSSNIPTLFTHLSAPEYLIGLNLENLFFNRTHISSFNYNTNGVYGTYSEVNLKQCAISAWFTNTVHSGIFPLHRGLIEDSDFGIRSMGELFYPAGSGSHTLQNVGAPKMFRNCRFNLMRGLPVGNFYFRNCTIGSTATVNAPDRVFSYMIDWNTGPRFINCTFVGNHTAFNDSLTSVQSARGASFPANVNCTGAPSNYVFTGGCMRAFWQTTEKHPNDTGAYDLEVGGFCAHGAYHYIKVMQIAASTSAVTVKARVKKNHATNIDVVLRVNPIESTANFNTDPAPVVADNDTSWQELALTFTPSSAGIVIIEIGYRASVSTSSTTKFFLGSVYA